MATKKPLGPRASVEFGVVGSKKAQGKNKSQKNFVRMLQSTAKLFGFKEAADTALTYKAKSGRMVTVRGSKSHAIKVPTGKKLKSKGGLQYDQLKSIPVPESASILQIKTFLKKASKKPKYFYSPDGRQHTLSK